MLPHSHGWIKKQLKNKGVTENAKMFKSSAVLSVKSYNKTQLNYLANRPTVTYEDIARRADARSKFYANITCKNQIKLWTVKFIE